MVQSSKECDENLKKHTKIISNLTRICKSLKITPTDNTYSDAFASIEPNYDLCLKNQHYLTISTT